MYLLLPFAAAVLFAIASLLFKRAFSQGATTSQAFHTSNIISGLFYLPLALLERQPVPWPHLWQPITVGMFIFVGGYFTLAAIRRADVSLVTPLLGTKAIFVAVGTVLVMSQPVPPQLWAATLLTAAGILLLGSRDMKVDRRGSSVAIGLVLLSASAFATADIFLQLWAPAFGAWAFIAIVAASLPVLTALSMPFEKGPVFRLPGRRAGSLLAGGIILAMQSMMIAIVLGFFGDAARVNVVYSSRGLWAFIFTPLAARWLGMQKEGAAPGTMAFRLAGTVLVILAVALALWR
ncbi:MAG: EamA family transporter [Verrucomicrobiales bacterium]